MVLPAATMCINVQKPGVPDSVEQKRLVRVVLHSTGVLQQFYTLNCSGLKPISYMVSVVVISALVHLTRFGGSKNCISLLDRNLWCSHWIYDLMNYNETNTLSKLNFYKKQRGKGEREKKINNVPQQLAGENIV